MESEAIEQAAKIMGNDGFLREVFYQADSAETFLKLMTVPRSSWIEILDQDGRITLESIEKVKNKVAVRRKKRGLAN